MNPLNKEESARILDQSTKIVTFFDAPGHREFSKTMIRSILGADAQYGLILVPGPEEARLIRQEEDRTRIPRLDEITREHLILMSSQKAPFFVAISKMDKTREEDFELVYNVLRSSLKDIGKIPLTLRSPDEIPLLAKEIQHGVIVPVVPFSALDSTSIALLTELLRSVPSTTKHASPTDTACAYVDKVYRGIKGTNVVVTGTVKSGIFKRGQIVKVGPEKNNQFQEGRLFSIEMFKKRISAARAGDLFGFDIKDVDKHTIRRGQMITDPEHFRGIPRPAYPSGVRAIREVFLVQFPRANPCRETRRRLLRRSSLARCSRLCCGLTAICRCQVERSPCSTLVLRKAYYGDTRS